MTKAVKFGETKDVTSKYKDVNEYDRLYETGRGYVVKVRVTARPMLSESITFDITGSWVDSKTGKARAFEDGEPFIVPKDQLTIAGDSPVDMETELQDARLRMVNRVDLIAANYYAAQALKHVRRA